MHRAILSLMILRCWRRDIRGCKTAPMPAVANVRIHSTQFPQEVRRALVESLRRREINHKFLYDSLKQTNKWLALHQAYSPSRADADCGACYDASFAAGVK